MNTHLKRGDKRKATQAKDGLEQVAVKTSEVHTIDAPIAVPTVSPTIAMAAAPAPSSDKNDAGGKGKGAAKAVAGKIDPMKRQQLQRIYGTAWESQAALAEHQAHWSAALGAFDPGLQLSLEPGEGTQVMSAADADAILRLLLALPHGVEAMSPDIKGLVQTSTNMGVIKTENGVFSRILRASKPSLAMTTDWGSRYSTRTACRSKRAPLARNT